MTAPDEGARCRPPTPAQPPTAAHGSAVGATWAGIRDLFRRRRQVGPLGPEERLDGKVALVTGGTVGLGRAIAEQLAARGARVVVTGRDPRGLPALGADAPVTFAEADFADLRRVRALVDRLDAAGLRFARVVLNAGMVAQRARQTPDGFDEMEQVNVLAAAALFSGLWTAGRIADPPGRPRVVVVGSEAHRSAVLEDVAAIGRPRAYSVGHAVAEYGRTKLLVLLFAMAMHRRMADRLEVHALCPGAVNSEIAREAPRWSMPLLKGVFAVAFQSPRRAAEPAVYLTCAREMAGRSGTYLHLLERKAPSPAAMSPAVGDAAWDRIYALLAPRGFVDPAS